MKTSSLLLVALLGSLGSFVACGADEGAAEPSSSPPAGDGGPGVVNGSDGSVPSDAAVEDRDAAAPLPSARYAYHHYDGHVWISAIDPTTGGIQALGATALPVDDAVTGPFLSPDQKTMLFVQRPTKDVYVYAVDLATGWLKSVGKSKFSGDAARVVFHPNGKIVYVAEVGSGIQAYDLETTTGALTPRGSAIAIADLELLAGTPDGRFLYASAATSLSVLGYSIGSDGALTPLAGGIPMHQRSGAKGSSLDFDASGKYLAISLNDNAGVDVLAVDSTSGALSPLSGAPYPTSGDATRSTFSPNGRFVYTVTSNGLVGHAIDASTLAVTPLTLPMMTFPKAVSIDPTGSFLYAESDGGTLIWKIGADGTLTTQGSSPLGGRSLTMTSGDPVRFELESAYLVDSTPTAGVSSYAIDSSGALTQVGGVNPVNLGYEVVVAPSGRWAYAISPIDGLHAYTRSSTGGLQEIADSPLPVAGTPYHLAIHPSETSLVVTQRNGNTTSLYEIDGSGRPTYLHAGISTIPSPGGATFDSSGNIMWVTSTSGDAIYTTLYGWNGASFGLGSFPTEAGGHPSAVAVAPDGKHAFASLGGLGKVESYLLDDDHRTPKAKSSIAVGTAPGALSVDPSSRTLYVVDSGGEAIYSFTIDPESAVLQPTTPPSVASAANPYALAIDASGRLLLAACGGGATPGGVAVYTVGASGALTAVAKPPSFASTFLGVALVTGRK